MEKIMKGRGMQVKVRWIHTSGVPGAPVQDSLGETRRVHRQREMGSALIVWLLLDRQLIAGGFQRQNVVMRFVDGDEVGLGSLGDALSSRT